MNKVLMVAIGGLLVGGVAYAGYQGLGMGQQYADVLSSDPITVREPIFAQVLSAAPIERSSTSTREVCEDKVVERREAERFGDKDGMVAGAVIGGLVGSQVGGGKGKKLATVAGVVAGGYAGREIDRKHEGGKKVTETVTECKNVSQPSSKVVGYDVQYALDGEVGTMRMDSKPGEQVQLGERDKIVGYNVTWSYKGQTGEVNTTEKPGPKLPINDGVIMVAEMGSGPDRG